MPLPSVVSEQPTAETANSLACRATAWTAWKPFLQKAATANDAKVQTVAGGGDPGSGLSEPADKNSQQPNSADGVEAVPPKDGNSRRCKGSDCSRGR